MLLPPKSYFRGISILMRIKFLGKHLRLGMPCHDQMVKFRATEYWNKISVLTSRGKIQPEIFLHYYIFYQCVMFCVTGAILYKMSLKSKSTLNHPGQKIVFPCTADVNRLLPHHWRDCDHNCNMLESMLFMASTFPCQLPSTDPIEGVWTEFLYWTKCGYKGI